MSNLDRLSVDEFQRVLRSARSRKPIFVASAPCDETAEVGVAKVGSVSEEGSPTFAREVQTVPTFASGERLDLEGFDKEPEVAAAVCGLLGLLPGEGERSVLEVGEHRVLVALWLDRKGLFKLRVLDGWPSSPRRKVLTLVEAFMAHTTGVLASRPSGPLMARWKLRMLVAIGRVRPATIALPSLPPTAPTEALETWNVVRGLLEVRRIDEPPGTAVPLVAPTLSRWSGRPEARLRRGKFWLEQHGYLVKARTEPSSYPERPTQLWLIRGDDPLSGEKP